MSRKEFMERLEKLLLDISDSEREEALQYYNDYFDDAGAENEAAVIGELVSPEQVAQKIQAGLSDTASEYTEQGYEDTRFRDHQDVIAGERFRRGEGGGEEGKRGNGKKETNFWKILAIVLLILLAAPLVVPLAGGLLLVLAVAVITVLAAAVGIVAAAFMVLVSGIVLIVIGIAKMFAVFPVGMAMLGVGCLLFGIGLLFFIGTLWIGIKLIPWMIRGIVKLVSYPFRKAGGKK